MEWKKISISTVLGGLAITLIGLAVNQATLLINPSYNPLTLGGARAPSDPLLTLSLVYPFVLALAFSIVFHFFRLARDKMLPLKSGIHFGLLVWMLVTLPGMFLVYTTMDYGKTFFLSNTIGQLLEFEAAGIVIAWIFSKGRKASI